MTRSNWGEGKAVVNYQCAEKRKNTFLCGPRCTKETHIPTAEQVPFKTIKTFFHWVLPTFGVWQNRILCLSHTNIRSKTNLETEVWERFFSAVSLQTFLRSSSLSIWTRGWRTRFPEKAFPVGFMKCRGERKKREKEKKGATIYFSDQILKYRNP